MNYLSHFYFDQHNNDPYYIAGIALPDMVKTCNRRWNVHPDSSVGDDSFQSSIVKGWNRHLAVDALFHNSGFFKTETGKIKNYIAEIDFENRNIRPFVLAHIGLELILDHYLLKTKKVSSSHYYQILASCDSKEFSTFLKQNGIENSELIEKFYAQFIDYRYLNNYQNNENFAYALNRICKRVFGAEISLLKQEELGFSLNAYIKDSENTFIFIFNEISNQLLLNEVHLPNSFQPTN